MRSCGSLAVDRGVHGANTPRIETGGRGLTVPASPWRGTAPSCPQAAKRSEHGLKRQWSLLHSRAD